MTREDKLIKRMEQGDMDAVDELMEMFYPEILRYCLWHAPNRFLAEDAAQETCLKFLRFYDRYAHRGKCRAFLYKIAANTCIDMGRKSHFSDVSFEELTAELTYSEPGFEDVQSEIFLRQLVSSLPQEQREIVLLRFGQDLTLREISMVVNAPLRTVQSRLRMALKKLKQEFRKEDYFEK